MNLEIGLIFDLFCVEIMQHVYRSYSTLVEFQTMKTDVTVQRNDIFRHIKDWGYALLSSQLDTCLFLQIKKRRRTAPLLL